MTFLLFSNLLVGICLLALIAAIVLNFRAGKMRRGFAEKRSPVSTLTMTAVGLLVYLTIRLQWGALPLRDEPLFLALRSAGLLLFALGTAFNIWGRIHLKGNWADHVRIYDDQSLATDGPYRIVRHPLYASLVWMIYGAALAYLNPLAAAENLLLFYPMMIYRARQEESALMEKFGETYGAYRRKTGRFLPRVTRLRQG